MDVALTLGKKSNKFQQLSNYSFKYFFPFFLL